MATTSIDITNDGIQLQYSGEVPTPEQLIALMKVAGLIPMKWGISGKEEA